VSSKRITLAILLIGLLSLSACEFPRYLEEEDTPVASDTPTPSPTVGVAASWTPSPTADSESAQPTQEPSSQSAANVPIGIDNLEQIAVQTRIESDLNTNFSALDLSPNGRYIAFAQSGDPQLHIRVWDFQEGQLLQPLDFHTANVSDVVFSPDGQWLASCSLNGEVALWDVGSWELADSFSTDERGASALAFSPDSQLLAVGGVRNQLGVWTIPDLERVNYFELAGPFPVETIIFTADGSQYYADSGYADVTVRNTADGELVQSFRGEACIGGFDLSSDESNLAYSSECSDAYAPHEPLAAIAVRDIATGDALVYGDRRDVSTTLYYTADDTLILTSSGQTLRFWDATDGSLVDQLLVGDYWFEFLLSDDGSLLIIGASGGQILIYAVESPGE
jgi:WD40 repeat protein